MLQSQTGVVQRQTSRRGVERTVVRRRVGRRAQVGRVLVRHAAVRVPPLAALHPRKFLQVKRRCQIRSLAD